MPVRYPGEIPWQDSYQWANPAATESNYARVVVDDGWWFEITNVNIQVHTPPGVPPSDSTVWVLALVPNAITIVRGAAAPTRPQRMEIYGSGTFGATVDQSTMFPSQSEGFTGVAGAVYSDPFEMLPEGITKWIRGPITVVLIMQPGGVGANTRRGAIRGRKVPRESVPQEIKNEHQPTPEQIASAFGAGEALIPLHIQSRQVGALKQDGGNLIEFPQSTNRYGQTAGMTLNRLSIMFNQYGGYQLANIPVLAGNTIARNGVNKVIMDVPSGWHE